MACDHDWTIKFLDINDGDPFEIRPIEMSLKMSRHEYDFCRAKAPWEVGEEMKPHTRYDDGALRGFTPVSVCHNGNPIRWLMFRPDWVDYGSEFTHLQFHDQHEALADGTVDIQRNTVSLKKIYPEIVNSANNRLIDEVKFTIPDNQTRHLIGGIGGGPERGTVEAENGDTETVRLLDASYAVDFDQISPERALRRLNKKFRLKSWVNSRGTLIVGVPEHNSVRHIAASDDERVWRYKDPNISHGREPIKKIIVEGAWVDEPGREVNPLDWFDQDESQDAKAIGIAEREDVDYGSTSYVSSTKAKRDALPHVARLALKEKMKQQNAGTIEIDPDISGTKHTDPLDLMPGDLLHIVPEDAYFDNPTADSGAIGDPPDNPGAVCGVFVNNEVYLVSEVEHNVTKDGEWQLFADLGMFSDVPIRSFMSYFDPTSDEWVDNSEIANNGSLEGGLFESI